MNTLHWHVVDSQSFPLVVPGFEALSEKGAYNPASVYTQKDVQDIVAYAAAVRLYFSRVRQLLNSYVKQRGIDVMAEIDTPGHTSAISKAFPEHIACPEATPWSLFANGFYPSLFPSYNLAINIIRQNPLLANSA